MDPFCSWIIMLFIKGGTLLRSKVMFEAIDVGITLFSYPLWGATHPLYLCENYSQQALSSSSSIIDICTIFWALRIISSRLI
ncbi:hypothetical protein KP509_18G007000 [Ceratopteris richardii]|uniref:Uncharacterized protein n=1 Tax=Ceratopteris richardii TaxID=49495 RepID=A0A8T2SQX7_CERRI|nr:hypothetical protein KP509_18G007000 [Ceratopteris richardii]